MHPIRFKETDVVFKSPKNAPDGVVGDLFTKKVYSPDLQCMGQCSAWAITEEELAILMKTKVIYLTVFSPSHPVVSIGVGNPTEDDPIKSIKI